MELMVIAKSGRCSAFESGAAPLAADGLELTMSGSQVEALASGLDWRGARIEIEMAAGSGSELLDRLAGRGSDIELNAGELLVLVETEPCQEVRIHAPREGESRPAAGEAVRVDGRTVSLLTGEDGVGGAVVPAGAEGEEGRVEVRAMSADGALRRTLLRVG